MVLGHLVVIHPSQHIPQDSTCHVCSDARAGVRFPSPRTGAVPPLGHHVSGVLQQGTRTEMRRVHAGRHVTRVQEHVSLTDWTMLHDVAHPMRGQLALAHPECAVATFTLPCPDPATLGAENLAPEALRKHSQRTQRSDTVRLAEVSPKVV